MPKASSASGRRNTTPSGHIHPWGIRPQAFIPANTPTKNQWRLSKRLDLKQGAGHQGGFYCDINKGIFTNLGSFCSDETGFVLSFESNECIVFPDMEVASLLQHPTKVVIQWAFGATSGHPILKSIIKEIPKIASFIEGVRVHNVKEAVLMTTGPGVFTRVVRQHIAAEGVADIRQVGVDFDGTGRHRLAGTKPSASAARAHYAKAGSRVIIR